MPRTKAQEDFIRWSREDRDIQELLRSRRTEAKEKIDYYKVTPKGFELLSLLSARMDEIEKEGKGHKGDPQWQEYQRLHHSSTMLILASSSHGVFINPTYEEEQSEALEDLLEGGYIVRSAR